MAKKLPGVFQNPIDHPVKNNKDYFYLDKEETKPEEKEELTREEKVKKELFGANVNQKINQIFSSSNYIYKADVEIQFKDKVVETKIIGKSGHSLITFDNTLIPIDDIVDIKLLKQKK